MPLWAPLCSDVIAALESVVLPADRGSSAAARHQPQAQTITQHGAQQQRQQQQQSSPEELQSVLLASLVSLRTIARGAPGAMFGTAGTQGAAVDRVNAAIAQHASVAV
jgi:hypothetical protein